MKKLFFISIFIFSIISQNVFAQVNNIYLIENIEGRASTTSSGEAKTLATKNARRTAFRDLLAKLSLDSALIYKVTDEDIFDTVLSEQISDEKISPNEYVANFSILFSKSIVEKVLQNQNVKKAESELSENYLLVPVKVLSSNGFENNLSKFALWGQENEWMEVINSFLKKRVISQFIIPEGDISNIAALNQDNIENFSFGDLEMMLSKYKSSNAIVMFFSYDKIDNKVTIFIQDITKLQKKKFKLSFVNVDRLSYEDLTNKVCEKVIEYLINSKTKESQSNKNFVRIEIPISGLGNWLMIKDRIERSNLINKLDIESISKDYATISINYVNKKEGIIESFSKLNLFLERKNDGIYSLIAK